MINFLFDIWKTSAPSENQRTSIFSSYFSNMVDIVGIWFAKTLAQRNFLTLGQRWLNDVAPT